MQKYLKISNQADQVSRISLEKLGLSTKRNNPSTIGKFGSGIKFAPIAALRNGWDWIFTGSDSDGDYTLKYEVIDEGGIPCIQYNYGTYTKSSSFTIDAGTLSWTDPFQIYREAVSNAIDGATENGGQWSIDIVEAIDNSPGEFAVFVTAAPELMNIYDNHHLYFSDKRSVLFSMYNTKKVLGKVDNNTRVYSHNVLIYKNELDSIFDYCLDDLDLNEERTIKSEWMLNASLESIFCNADRTIIRQIIAAATSGRKYYEFEASSGFSYIDSYIFNSYWLECFQGMYGENAVIIDKATASLNIDSSLSMQNLTPIVIAKDSAYRLLKQAGIPSAMDRIGEEVKYKIDYNLFEYPKLMEAISVARIAEPRLEAFIPTLAVFDSDSDQVLGLTINMKKKEEDRRILIDKGHAEKSSIAEIISTLIHEYDHAASGLPDAIDHSGRMFRETADQRIGKLIYENYRPNPFFIEDGMICFKMSEVSEIGSDLIMKSEYSNSLDCFIFKVGKFALKVRGQNLTKEFSTHEPKFIRSATVVSYPGMVAVDNLEVIR